MNKNKGFTHRSISEGFTLIELLVVIAIIGILASVVLASLTNARQKAQDAAIQSTLSSMRAQAELFYSTTGANTYGTAGTTCSTAGSLFGSGTNSLAALLATITTTTDCGNSTTAWSVAAAGVSNATYYCADSTGVSRSANASGTAYDSVTGGTTPAHASAGAVSCS